MSSSSPRRSLRGAIGGLFGIFGLAALAGVMVAAFLTPATAVVSGTTSSALSIFDSLPSHLTINQPMLPTNIYATDANGKPVRMATFYEQNRVPVEYRDISPLVLDALISAEDPRFWNHGGVDVIGTTRAVLKNSFSSASRQGGSTIAQQYVKNVHVQECESTSQSDDELVTCWKEAVSSEGPDGIQRKLQEMRYALTLQQTYSKTELLTGYLNIANFGGRTYGIEAAAQRYFGVSAKKLNLAQATALVGMVQNPNRYRIDQPDSETNGAQNGYALTKTRQTYVVGRMLADGKITQAQHDAVVDAPIKPRIQPMNQGCATAGDNAYFCEYVVAEFMQNPAFGKSPEDRSRMLRRGGLDIYTTLDAELQKTTVSAVHENVPARHDVLKLGGASVSVEAKSGRILAMAQNTKFTQDAAVAKRDGAYTALNYAADRAHGGSIGFPVGSSYKLFTLLDWLEQGNSVTQGVNGSNRTFRGFSCDGKAVYNGSYIRNYGGAGGSYGNAMSFTAKSLNSGYLAMAEQLNLCDINRVADRLGVHLGDGTRVTESNLPYESVLGSRNIAPLQMSVAYATVANGGKYCAPRSIDRVTDADGADITPKAPACRRALDPGVAAAAAKALSGVMTGGGTGTQSNPFDGTPLLGKTGTHEDYQTMMILSSTRVATAVWVGNVTGQGDLYGWGLQNRRHDIARSVQHTANDLFGGESFPAAPRHLTEVPMVTVPSLSGMTEPQAVKAITDAGLIPQVRQEPGMTPEGTVLGADPATGLRVAKGSTVVVRISDGRGAYLPDVTGRSGPGARAFLESRGFTNVSPCYGEGRAVTAMEPQPGTAIAPDDRVELTCD